MLLDWEKIQWDLVDCQTEGCPGRAALIYDDRELLCLECADTRLERLQILSEFGRDALENFPPIGMYYEVVHKYRDWSKENEQPTDA